MTPLPRGVLAAAFALAFGAVAAFVVTAAPLPMWYLPLDDMLALGAKPPGLVIDYYARVLGVVVAVTVGALAGFAAAPRLSGRAAVLCLRLCLAWAAFGGALAVGLSLSQVWNRPLHALTLPAP